MIGRNSLISYLLSHCTENIRARFRTCVQYYMLYSFNIVYTIELKYNQQLVIISKWLKVSINKIVCTHGYCLILDRPSSSGVQIQSLHFFIHLSGTVFGRALRWSLVKAIEYNFLSQAAAWNNNICQSLQFKNKYSQWNIRVWKHSLRIRRRE